MSLNWFSVFPALSTQTYEIIPLLHTFDLCITLLVQSILQLVFRWHDDAIFYCSFCLLTFEFEPHEFRVHSLHILRNQSFVHLGNVCLSLYITSNYILLAEQYILNRNKVNNVNNSNKMNEEFESFIPWNDSYSYTRTPFGWWKNPWYGLLFEIP